jgi:hypothetical protein
VRTDIGHDIILVNTNGIRKPQDGYTLTPTLSLREGEGEEERHGGTKLTG